ncbi:hypothetical protein NST21_26715 [Peribacillus sp. FSL K6-1552]|uniref:hypothetical protein n=1 Tax=Peribacillus sp. FSL K6-1552 TaxID=2954514 RepID=UPI0030FA8803
MPRKPRIWYPGAMYHITSRGNRHSNIFLDDKDRLRYLHHLEETKEKYFFELHSSIMFIFSSKRCSTPSAILCISLTPAMLSPSIGVMTTMDTFSKAVIIPS